MFFFFFFVANAHILPGLTATACSNEAASITGNRGIYQSTGRQGKIKIDGCSRKQASSGSQLSNEEPKRGRITSIFWAISRSSMIEGDHRRSRATIAQFFDSLTSQAITRRIIFIKFILYYGELVEFLSRLLKRFSHLYVAQEAKTGFHVSTRPA